MLRQQTGHYVTISTVGETCRAFVPDPLPPAPPLQINEALQRELEQALVNLGRLDSLTLFLPDTSLFLYMYIRKEAVLSSQIEGTQSSLSDLLLFESEAMPGVPEEDVQEVSSYVAAMDYGLGRLREGFPLSLRLVREIHQILLGKGRGRDRAPGEYRRTQNWIGGTRPGNARHVPPPPHLVLECLGALEKFWHDDPVYTPTLIKAALAHVQFETIHPFLDGNGRLGRLLITLLFCAEGILREPLLYLSLYFKTHRQQYYELLQAMRVDGDWEAWLEFFVRGVNETAEQAIQTARQLAAMRQKDREQLNSLGRATSSALKVHQALEQRPILSIARLVEMTGLSVPAVTHTLGHLNRLGIVQEITGRQRHRMFGYTEYLSILGPNTEPIR